MNGYLRQSTASQSRLIGPFIDDTDFKTAKTGLTVANTDIKLRANGTTLSNKNSGGGTHQANGMYSVTWDATDTANVGELAFSVVISTALQVFGSYTVLEEAAYDAMFAASAPGYVVDQPVNVTKVNGTSQTARDLGASVLLSSGTGAGQLDFTSGVVKANLVQILGTALTETAGQIAAAFKKFFDKASPTGTINSLPDAVPDAAGGLPVTGTGLTAIPTLPAALVGGRIDASVGAMANNVLTASAINADAITDAKVANDVTIASVTGSVGSVTSGVTVATNNDKTGYGLSSAAVQAIWDALTSALTTAGSVGKRIVDFLTGDAYARLGAPAGASVSADVAAVKTDTAAIKAKTDNLPASPAAMGDIPSVGAIVDAVWDEDIVAAHTTADTAGKKLSQALILYEGS